MNQNDNNQEELSVAKTKGVTEFGLTQEQVNNPKYGPEIFNTMVALQTLSPETDGPSLLQMATEIPDYQLRAISEQGIAPEKLGLAIEAGQLIQSDTTTQLNFTPEEASLLADTLKVELPEDKTLLASEEQLKALGQTDPIKEIPLPEGVAPLNEADTAEFLKFATSIALEDSVQQARALQQQDNLQQVITSQNTEKGKEKEQKTVTDVSEKKENQQEASKEDTKLNMNAFLTPSAPKGAQAKDSENAKGIKSSSGKKNANEQTPPKPKRKGPKR